MNALDRPGPSVVVTKPSDLTLKEQGNSSVLHRKLNERPRRAISRFGSMILTDVDAVVDLSSGAGVSCLGHVSLNSKTVAANHCMYVHAQNWTHPSVEALADLLLSNAGWGGGGVLFLSSGTEAAEAACKLALQAQFEQGRRGRPSICARRHSYHGNSLGMLAIGHHPRRTAFRELVSTFPVFRFPAYMPTWEIGTDAVSEIDVRLEYIAGCLRPLEVELVRCKEENRPAIVIVEPIAGMALGVEPGSAEYLAALRALTLEHGATLIYDEVFCGNWRTGHAYAWQYYQTLISHNVEPDLVSIGKGLANGFVPLSAVVASASLRATLKSNRIWHSSTFQNHPYCCSIGLAVQKAQMGIGKKRAELIAALLAHVEELRKLPNIQVEGVGALWGIRLDRGSFGLHEQKRAELLAHGVSVYSDGGTVEGRGNTLLMAPPYTMSLATLDWAINVVKHVLAS